METNLKQLASNYQFSLSAVFSQYDYSLYNKKTNTQQVPFSNNEESHVIDVWGSKWKVEMHSVQTDNYSNSVVINVHFELLEGEMNEAGLAVEFCFDQWTKDNYVLLPAAAYNGNRFESRRISYSPKLLDIRDVGPDKPIIISDVPRLNVKDGPSCIQERSGSMSVPSVGFHDPVRKVGMWLLTEQSNSLGDYGYTITENRDRSKAYIRISSPLVRELYKYNITDNQYPSDDVPGNFKKGDRVSINMQLYLFNSQDIQTLFDFHLNIRNAMVKDTFVPPFLCFSSTFPVQENKFNEQNWVDSLGYYSVGMREMFLQDWQIGWTGGMISTYPLLFLGQEKTRQHVVRNFDFLFPAGQAPCGFFWDCGQSVDGVMKWYGGDIRKYHTKNWHLIRKSADALYYIIKQFWLMERLGITVKKEWKEGAAKCADAFVSLWNKYKQFGQFVDNVTGEIIVGGSTSAGLAPAALVFASQYFNKKEYMDVALASADYFYQQYVVNGLTVGGVGDAMQNPDSESAYGVLESFAVLHEQTRDPKWLNHARDMASQFASWVMSYNYFFHNDCLLKRMDIKTRGTVCANTQNKHGAPGICTHSGVALLRLYRATGNKFYMELLRDIAQHITQIMSHPSRPIPGMKPGWITERISTTDWFEGLGEIMYGSTWAETSLMLTTIEIPAVYVQPQNSVVFAIDQVDIEAVQDLPGNFSFALKNNTQVKGDFSIMIEMNDSLHNPLRENALKDCQVVTLMPGESRVMSFSKG